MEELSLDVVSIISAVELARRSVVAGMTGSMGGTMSVIVSGKVGREIVRINGDVDSS